MATQENSVSQAEASQTKQNTPDPCIVVIFGASGDLTKRKLLPALYHLEQQNLLPEKFAVVGVARRDLSKTFAPDMKDGIVKGGGVDQGEAKLGKFMERVHYFATEFDNDEGYEGLKKYLADLDGKLGTGGRRLFYLAVAPEFFADITQRIAKHGMAKGEGDAWVRFIIEKPFGTDLASAKKLNDDIHAVLEEDQIFRIDHYLGKEVVQNIPIFRFANSIFEPLWNSNYIDHIQITGAESIGIEGRGPFYEGAGALRDVLQNHVMEVLSFVAMEPPTSFESAAVRIEKLKVWKAIRPVPIEDTARGQYGPGKVDGQDVIGYRQEDRVNPESQQVTYAAMKLSIDNLRWAGVPFYIRAGKRLASRVTEVVVVFKQPLRNIFGQGELEPNVLTLRIQPDDGISVQFGNKVPGPTTTIDQVAMTFNYAQKFGKSYASGYERLLLDAMLGDGTLFAEGAGVEATWTLMTPILEAWEGQIKDFPNYAAGSWGPKEADELLQRDGREWRVS
ncbi:glucose-6-phosphate dehydrogenase [Terriglobus aquaticus]|uniref:Glucose-6-phosphate 1-dehydrogenase n=1 Tax=Terriglobus aquaticus TaxID=940139 RepID=A0ABW9KQC3_9BACT|nr:glucose-6-phosphate dehydrogenase [Terriglobus aquaticus]